MIAEQIKDIDDKEVEPEEEGAAFNLALNVIIPALILVFLSKENRLGPLYGLVVALSIPFIYGIYHFIRHKSFNILSLLGIISISITGGIRLFHLSTSLFAIKEALVPFTIGSIFLYLTLFNFKKMKPLLFNKKVFRTKLIESKLDKNKKKDLNNLIRDMLIIICVAFFVGALLNFIIARTIVVSEPGTVDFNEELGYFSFVIMIFVSTPLFLFLMLVVYFFVRKMMEMTGLSFDQVFGLDEEHKDKE
jgi:hypothetical protein